jgi:peroxiredoxin Q/BCP
MLRQLGFKLIGPHSVVSLSVLVLLSILATACGSEQELRVGDQAPDFTLPTAAGTDASLSDYVGKQPVLLFFHMAMG